MVATKTRRKLFKVAKELNLSHQTIIEFLEKKGFTVSGLNTPITDDMHDEILKRFAQEKVKADKIARRREEIAKEELEIIEEQADVLAGETELPTAESAVEEELHRSIDAQHEQELAEYSSMLAYHLGWEGEGAGPEARGKRIRPLLVLLTCSAAGGEWRNALPAAAAVELVHNFSLIHDDIQDNSPLRRGRETVWKRWGIPQAINAGDAMLTIAHLTLLRMENYSKPDVTLNAAGTLQQACLQLTKGQFLDLTYESQAQLSIDGYWQMVGGKTAALLRAYRTGCNCC